MSDKSGSDYPLPSPMPAPPSSDTRPPPSPYNKNPSDGYRSETPEPGRVG
jgi:hypothetical protein